MLMDKEHQVLLTLGTLNEKRGELPCLSVVGKHECIRRSQYDTEARDPHQYHGDKKAFWWEINGIMHKPPSTGLPLRLAATTTSYWFARTRRVGWLAELLPDRYLNSSASVRSLVHIRGCLAHSQHKLKSWMCLTFHSSVSHFPSFPQKYQGH